LPRKVFVANEILTAGAVNTNLMDQAVMVFADAAARTAALGSPSEGMVTYLEDTDSLELYTTVWGPVSPAITRADLPAGSVLQVVSTTKVDTFSSSSTSYTDVTGLSVTITPTSSSSKILVLARVAMGNSANLSTSRGQVLRGSTAIGGGTAAGSRSSGAFQYRATTGLSEPVNSFIELDSPATTSATTYKVQVASESGGVTTINFGRTDNFDNAMTARLASTITLMEVAG